MGLYTATLFYPESAPIKCPFWHCQWPLSIAIVAILTISFIVVIAFYVILVLRIKFKNDNKLIEETEPRKRSVTTTRNIRTMNRLSMNLIAFSVSKMPLIIVAIVALINLSDLKELGIGMKESCKTFHYSTLYYQVEMLASIAAILWLIGKQYV